MKIMTKVQAAAAKAGEYVVEDWRQWYRMASIWVFTAFMVVPQAAPLLSPELKAELPEWATTAISVAGFIGIVARLWNQEMARHREGDQ